MRLFARPRLLRQGVAQLRCLICIGASLISTTISLAGPPEHKTEAEPSIGAWRRIDRPGASGGTTTAFVHTADVDRSDPRLAGLMLHCSGNQIEAVFVVVEAFPPHVRPRITLRGNGEEAYFDATVIQAGTGLAIPANRLTSVDSPWRAAEDLEVHIGGADTGFGGIVRMKGLKSVVTSLTLDCARNK
jgi:hypothetical protein